MSLHRSKAIAFLFGALAAANVVYCADVTHAASGQENQASHSLPTREAGSVPPYAAIVLDANSGKVLHSASADELRHPASLTKIMTLYLLFERLETGKLRLDTQLAVSEYASVQAPTKLGLTPGQTIAVEDAIGGLVTKSANDAAVVIAEALAGNEQEFAQLMTRKAHALGMSRTVYRNASGLPNDEQVTTARDQALLGRAIQERFPRYYRYFAMPSFTFHGQMMRNHNHLLGQVDGLDGIKTGYTQASGFNLVASVHRNNRHIVSVVLGGASAGARDARMRSLIEEYILVAAPQKSMTAIADATKDSDEKRFAARRGRQAHVAEPNTKPTRVSDGRAVNSPTALGIYSVASSDRPITWPIPSGPPQSATSAMTAIPVPAAPSIDAISTGSAPADMETPIKPIPVKTVRANLASFDTAALAQNEKPIAPDIDNSTPSRPPFKPRLELPQKAGVPDTIHPSQADIARTAALQSTRQQAVSSDRAMNSDWSIQIGAFATEQEARKKLSAVAKSMQILGHASRVTESVTRGDHTLYRARFAGLQKDDAEAACRELKRSEIDCMIIKK